MIKGISRGISILMISITLCCTILGADITGTGNAYAASTKIVIEEIEYDPEDREVTIEFAHRVKYKKLKVYIYDAKGKKYQRYIIERDSDEIEIAVKKLVYGRKYKYKIKGIKRWGAKKFKTIKGTFRAIDR